MYIFSETGDAKPVLRIPGVGVLGVVARNGEKLNAAFVFWHEEYRLTFIAGEAQYVRTSVA
jgi:hypothetical protein